MKFEPIWDQDERPRSGDRRRAGGAPPLTRALRSEGLEIDTATNGEEGLRLALTGSYSVVILDLLMPGTDGMSVLRRLMRLRPTQPVIVLSCLADTTSKVNCLEMGADDYLPKPFVLDELLARIKARIRDRSLPEPSYSHHPQGRARPGPPGGGRRDRARAADPAGVDAAGGADAARGQHGFQERLLSSVWGYSFYPESNVVDVYVRRLRAKLDPDVISTVRGVGYRVDLG